MDPDVRKTNWTPEEDRIIIDAHSKIGNKWTNISKLLDGRPANAIKNHWNSTLLKRIQDSNGEPTPRRDRNRTKKPAPLRATEFDFRTQLQQHEDSSDCSPQAYQRLSSPDSSPEARYQEPQLVNPVRFHYPETPHHVFFNPFTDQSNTVVPVATNIWDAWPAPNVIHLTPSTSIVPHPPPAAAPNHSVSLTQNLLHTQNLANTSGFNGYAHNLISTLNSLYDTEHNNTHTNASSMNNNTGFNTSEPSSPEDFLEMYNPPTATNNAPLPHELQLCFDYPQQAGSVPLDTFTMAPLVDSSGMNVSNLGMNMSVNPINGMGVNNMGLLNLEIPGFLDM